MNKSTMATASATAILMIKRPEIRDAVRQVLKAQGLKAENIFNSGDDKDCLRRISKSEYSMLILDWEVGADRVQNVLNQTRKESVAEAHPVFLISAHNDDKIVAMAHEYNVKYVAVGEINVDTIREQIKGLVKEYTHISPIRKMLMAVETHRRQGQDGAGLDILERLFEKQPENTRIVLEMAEILIHLGHWDKAEDLLKRFIHKPEPYARIRHLYARCRMKRNDHAGAIAALKGAQLISPYNVERLLEMGHLFLKTERLSEAEQAFTQALDLAPQSKEAKFGRSTGKLMSGEINEALQILQGLANPRELSAVFNTAAILAIRSQHFDTGMGLYQKAAQLLSKNGKLAARIYYNMGIGFVKSGHSSKGLKCFQKAVEKDPDFKDAEHNLRILGAVVGGKVPADKAGEKVAERDFLAEFDEKLGAHLPMSELGLEGSDEEVELDDLFTDIDKVG